MAIITFLIIGWILNWFKFERLFIQAFKELFGKDVTKATYYFLFLFVGVFGEIVLLFKVLTMNLSCIDETRGSQTVTREHENVALFQDDHGELANISDVMKKKFCELKVNLQFCFCEFDGPRSRTCYVKILG